MNRCTGIRGRLPLPSPRGLRTHGEAIAVPVSEADPGLVATADVVVVGGPTHAHGLSHAATRKSAETAALKPDTTLKVEPGASGPGLREWFATLGRLTTNAAAFDTRLHGPSALTGRASKGISRALHRHGATLVSEPHSFLVNKNNQLEPGQEASARAWGDHIGADAAVGRRCTAVDGQIGSGSAGVTRVRAS
jgi:hypothetical protein